MMTANGKSPRNAGFAAVKRWLLLAAAIAATLALWLANREAGARAVTSRLASLKEMLFVLSPIFVILGLRDV